MRERGSRVFWCWHLHQLKFIHIYSHLLLFAFWPFPFNFFVFMSCAFYFEFNLAFFWKKSNAFKTYIQLITFGLVHFEIEVLFKGRKVGKYWHEFTKYSKNQLVRYWGITLKDIHMKDFYTFHEHLETQLINEEKRKRSWRKKKIN